MQKVHYSISGLQNTEMKTQLKNALNKIDGIQMVNVDAGRSTIEVGYNENADETNIRSCIEHVGCTIEK